MSRDSAGAYTLPSTNPVVTGDTIASAWANGTFADVAAALTESLDRNGRGAMLAAFKAFNGTLAAPGITWDSETGSGWYRVGAADHRYSMAGTNVFRVSAAGLLQMDGSGNFYRTGWRELPPTQVSAARTFTSLDCGKSFIHPGTDAAARVWTIQLNSASAYPDGGLITFVNRHGAGVITITPTDTMRLAGSGATGNRSLAADGIATAFWDATAGEWLISGTGLT